MLWKCPAITFPPSHSCALPLIECQYERQCVRTPPPALSVAYYAMYLYSANAPAECVLLQQSYSRPHRIFKPASLRFSEFFVWRRTEMTAERAPDYEENEQTAILTPGTCHPPPSISCFNSHNGYNAQGESHDREHHATSMWNAKCGPM
jgi:hypothetical protein